MRRELICCIAVAVSQFAIYGDDAVDKGQLLFQNSDFEQGVLSNWIVEGTAFGYQPTRGDNIQARSAGVNNDRSGHQGDWWVGTFERYQGRPGEALGQVQGDAPTGGLLSADFIIRQPYITFLIGGGEKDAAVHLIVDGEIVHTASGRHREQMHRVYWNVEQYSNRKGMIYIKDVSKGAWGHINADDFRATDTGPRLLFPNSDFEAGDLTSWTAEGAAFGTQPTRGDNALLRDTREAAQPQGMWWIGTFENYQGKEGEMPGSVQDDLPQGTLRSVPFEITGNAIAFFVGGGRAEEVGVHLHIDEKKVHSARGSKSELLRPVTWDVSEYRGKTAQIEIVDNATGKWGHINVDYFHYVE